MIPLRLTRPACLLALLAACFVSATELRFVPGSRENADKPYTVLAKSVGSRPDARFVDNEGRLVYGFRTSGLKQLKAKLRLANNFRVFVSTDGKQWREALNATKIHGRDRHDGDVEPYELALDELLPADAVYLLFRDASTTDGWGAYVAEVVLESDAPEGHDWVLPPPPPPPGMILSWQVLGSFAAEDRHHLLDPPPALGNMDRLCPPTGGTWKTATNPTGRISLLAPELGLAPNTDCLAFAHVFVKVERDVDAFLLAGSDDALAIYVNGALIWRHEVLRGYLADADRVPVYLGAGWNRVLLAVGNGAAGWEFGARLVQADGTPLPTVAVQAEPPQELGGELPMPKLPPSIDLSLARLDPRRAQLQEGKLSIPLLLELVNRGGAAEEKQVVSLRHGNDTLQSWDIAATGRGLLTHDLPLSNASWQMIASARFPLSVTMGKAQLRLDCPFLPRLFAEAGDAILETHPEEGTVLQRLGLARRHWRKTGAPAADWMEHSAAWTALARNGQWEELAKAVGQFQEADGSRWSTTVQCAAVADDLYDVSPDGVMVYGGRDPAPRLRQWRRRGARVQIMTGIAWGDYQDYHFGRYDGKSHEDEVQTNKNGELIGHGGDVYYWVPTKSYADYLCQRLAPALELPADGVCLEEPEFWMRGGWSAAFKREWADYFGEAWQPPDSTPESRYRAWQLRRHLYTRCLKQVADYLKARRPDWECIVATHSLINYTSWGIASPESALSGIESCDTVIAQVWNDTILTPCTYDGVRRSRPFATAYLEFAQMAGMMGYSGRSLVFLADPVADNAERSWSICRRRYEDTVVAGLFQGNANRFELMPWPDRVFKGRRQLSNREEAEPTTIPAGYRTSLLATCEALRNMPQGTAQASPLAVAVSDSMQAQADFGEASGSADFFGQALPLVMRGWQPQVVHLEQVANPAVLADVRILVLSYNGQTPPAADAHAAIAAWVKKGGILLSLHDPDDPFERVREWWNRAPDTDRLPQQHLHDSLGLGTDPEEGWHEVGAGQVFVQHVAPRRFAATGEDKTLANWVFRAAQRAKLPLRPESHAVVRRGPYVAAACFEESPEHKPVTLSGTYVDLFSDRLDLVSEPTLRPGQCGFWVDMEAVPETPNVVATSSRIDGWQADEERTQFVSSAPAGGEVMTWVRLPAPPAGIRGRLHNGTAVPVRAAWFAEINCLRLRYPAQADGVWIDLPR